MSDQVPRILVVEDDPDVLWTFEVAAQGQFELLKAPSYEVALQKISTQNPIAALITDFYFGSNDESANNESKDGLTISLEFRRRNPKSPIFLITGEIRPNKRVDELLKLDKVHTFHKPFQMRALLNELRVAIGGS